MDNLSKEDQEQHVYLLMCGWVYERSETFGGSYYVCPYQTSSGIFGLTAAYRCQKKNERGEYCGRD